MYIDWDGVFEEPVWELPENGIFKKPLTAKFLVQYPKETAIIIEKKFSEFSPTGDKSLSEVFKSLEEFGQTKVQGSAEAKLADSQSIFTFLLFAFLGGIILNLMPCVLPVISLKLFGLIVHSGESKRQILKHNLAYTIGVLFSFSVLASVVFFLKQSGEQIGWGFQLQSPLFVFFMLLLIFIMALNMLGLFEFYTPGGKHIGNTELKKGFSGDFINGVLATILSTPCSAPFLGSALPFAFTSTTLNIYLIFLSVGIGLSFPFIITGLFPSLVKLLPKPGAWMEKLKNILGLTMLLTAVWLYDVLGSLISMGDSGIYINALLTLLFFAFYFRKYISKNILASIIIFLLPALIFAQLLKTNSFEVSTSTNQKSKTASDSNWIPWTPKAMKAAQKSKGHTFINFTAAWCLTCKVNKKIVLNSSDFKDLIKDKNISLLEGDWTKRDDKITKFLRSHNIVGVPAYFMVKPDGSVTSLGETISINKIKKSL